jgi:transcriptional regulator with XRE-family HTH domain
MIAAVLDPVACVRSLWSQRVASVLPGMTMTSPLGEFIRHQRELQDLSMRQLADLVGISNPYLSQIERGLREPSEKVLDAIAQNLELSAQALHEHGGRRPEDEADGGDESSVVAAIRADPKLTARQRAALLEVYDAFVGHPRRRRGAQAPDR